MTADEQQPQIAFTCPSCGQPVQADSHLKGSQVACPHCGAAVAASRPPSESEGPPTETMPSQPGQSPVPIGSQAAVHATGTSLKPAVLIAAVLLPAQILILGLGYVLLRGGGDGKDAVPPPSIVQSDGPAEPVVEPAERELAVDRTIMARAITELIAAHPRIELRCEEVTELPEGAPEDVRDSFGRAHQALAKAAEEDREEMIELMQRIRDALQSDRPEDASTLREELDEILFFVD